MQAPEQKLQQSDTSFIVFDKPPETEVDLALELSIIHWHKTCCGRKHALQQLLVGLFESNNTAEPLQITE
jgi:hypothetical protein